MDISGCELSPGREWEGANLGTGKVLYFDLSGNYRSGCMCKNLLPVYQTLQYRQYTLQKKKGKINLYLAAQIESIWLTPHLSRVFIKTSKSGLFTVKINVTKSIHFIHEKYFQAFSSLFLFL